MGVDKSKIGLTFGHERITRPQQEAALRADGAEDIKSVGKDCDDWREAVRIVRHGDEVRILGLVLVATPRGKDKLPPSGQPAEFILEVHERGGIVIEVHTGRRSDDAKQRRAMIADAVRVLRGGGRRLPASGRPAGRPEKAFSAVALEHNRKAWRSRDYATNAVAAAHMLEGMTARDAWKLFGKSGRPWPSRRKRKT